MESGGISRETRLDLRIGRGSILRHQGFGPYRIHTNFEHQKPGLGRPVRPSILQDAGNRTHCSGHRAAGGQQHGEVGLSSGRHAL
jgi:hypothetical protein